MSVVRPLSCASRICKDCQHKKSRQQNEANTVLCDYVRAIVVLLLTMSLV